MSAACWWCGAEGATLETELLQRDRGASEWRRCLACRSCARRLRPELLATVAPAKVPEPPPPGPGRGKKKDPVTVTGGFSDSGSISEQRLRAIAERAPEHNVTLPLFHEGVTS